MQPLQPARHQEQEQVQEEEEQVEEEEDDFDVLNAPRYPAQVAQPGERMS